MNWEEAFVWYLVGFGCGAVVVAALGLWEKWAKNELSRTPPPDTGYDAWTQQVTCYDKTKPTPAKKPSRIRRSTIKKTR